MEFFGFDERLKLALKIGESQYREFKSAYSGPPDHKLPRDLNELQRDVAKTLVAFANAEGGELFVGVEDDARVTGIPFSGEKITYLLSSSETHVHGDTPLPKPRKAQIQIDGQMVLYFAVPKGTDYIYLTSDGRCLRRRDRDSLPVSCESINATRLEDRSREWEREVAHGATLADLDIDLIASISGQIAYGVSIEKCLQYLDLAEFALEGLSLKKASLLLFAKDIRRWHLGSTVRIMTINGKEKRSGKGYNVIRDEIVSNNILRLIDESWQRLMVAIVKHTQLTDQARFQQSYLYPEIACREALLNAIVHRNYAIEGRGIEIEIYTDRLEINSPGMLLTTLSLDDLRSRKGVHESRNPLIARVLREIGFVREMGEGIRRIYDVMRSNALAEPLFESDNTGFSVTLYHHSMYDPRVKLWLSGFEKYNLTENQMAVVALGFNGQPFSTQEVIDRLGIVDTDHVREVLTPLIALNLVERILPRNRAYAEATRLRIPKREIKVYRIVEPHALKQKVQQIEPTAIATEDDEFDKKSSTYNFFVANIPYDISGPDLYDFLSSCGEVLSLNVPSGADYGSVNKGYAFVTFNLKTDLDQFLRQNDGKELRGKHLHFRMQKS
jgi:ATP-dependent DNA helicase RecG